MPRPGPRPYECIRRAWHSETHQALRGSLTQEIFRIVTEIHNPETRSKKEWQEKLPIVVLRAEEILYSKARTEAEYTDVSTLKSRLEDAVNTMIRRTDENKEKEEEESGVFMEPCVEAALSLGCLPKMNPRGQRTSTSRMTGGSSTLRRSALPSSATATTITTTTTTTHSGGSLSPTSSTVTQPFLTKPFAPQLLSSLPGMTPMLEPPRMNVNPSVNVNVNVPQCYNTIGGATSAGMDYPPPQQFKYASTTPFGLEMARPSSFMLRDQGSLPASLICAEDFHARGAGGLGGVMGNIYGANTRYQQGIGNMSVVPPMLSDRGTSSAQGPGVHVTPGREHDFLELSLGLPKGSCVSYSGKAAGKGEGGRGGGRGEMQSSSSSSGSMSWQSEGARECSKRKALPWPPVGTTGEVAKRQKDFLF